MNDIIKDFQEQSTNKGQNTYVSEVEVQISASKLTEEAVGAWGRSLASSRAAPSWARLEPLIVDAETPKSTFRVVTDENGEGAMVFNLSEEQKTGFTAILNELIILAEKTGSTPDEIEKAKASYQVVIDGVSFNQRYDEDSAEQTVGKMVELTAILSPVFNHQRHGELNQKSLVSLSKIKAPPKVDESLQGDEALEAAIAAQMPRYVPKSDIGKYQSMGQMVKAKDAAVLEEYIDLLTKENKWNEDMEETASKLLFHAALDGSNEIIKILIEKGKADVDFVDNKGNTPLIAACANNLPDTMQILIDAGADKKRTPIDGRSFLMMAAAHDAIDSIKKLHALGFDLNETDLEGKTALHHAALGENEVTARGALKTLLELGANPTIIDLIGDEGGCMPEHYVSEDEENDEIYAKLVQYREDWEAGKTGPQSGIKSAISSARAKLGF